LTRVPLQVYGLEGASTFFTFNLQLENRVLTYFDSFPDPTPSSVYSQWPGQLFKGPISFTRSETRSPIPVLTAVDVEQLEPMRCH